VRDARPDGAVTDLAYDAAGRLAAAARDGAALANYRFNARGERVAKVAGGRRTHSLYDTRGQLLAEYDAGAASATPVPPAPEATLDNTDPGAGATGGWTSAAERPGYLGTDYAEVEGGTSHQRARHQHHPGSLQHAAGDRVGHDRGAVRCRGSRQGRGHQAQRHGGPPGRQRRSP
jgi:hypothetical protein